jgi:hypothetical protein
MMGEGGFWCFPEICSPSIHTFSRHHNPSKDANTLLLLLRDDGRLATPKEGCKSSPQCLAALHSV